MTKNPFELFDFQMKVFIGRTYSNESVRKSKKYNFFVFRGDKTRKICKQSCKCWLLIIRDCKRTIGPDDFDVKKEKYVVCFNFIRKSYARMLFT